MPTIIQWVRPPFKVRSEVDHFCNKRTAERFELAIVRKMTILSRPLFRQDPAKGVQSDLTSTADCTEHQAEDFKTKIYTIHYTKHAAIITCCRNTVPQKPA
jgi:hypothetical protein